MLTLSYGFKKPQTNDRGPVVFPALEGNFQQLNDHAHNGIDSAPVASSSIAKTVQTLVAANWVALGDGHFYQNVTLPGVLEYDNVTIICKLSTGEQIYPSIAKVSTTQYSVKVNDNTIDVKVYIN